MKENTLLIAFLVVGLGLVGYSLYHSSQVKKGCEARGAVYYRNQCFHPGMP